jgi:general secretion pathway protein C
MFASHEHEHRRYHGSMKRFAVFVVAVVGCQGSQAPAVVQPVASPPPVEPEPAPTEPSAAEPASTEPSAAEPASTEPASALDLEVTRIDEGTFRISREAFDRVHADPTPLVRGARIVPATEGDKVVGMRLSGIRPGSIYARLGLETGDTVHRINGRELTTVQRVLDVYEELKEASAIVIDLTRRGSSVAMTYRIE